MSSSTDFHDCHYDIHHPLDDHLSLTVANPLIITMSWTDICTAIRERYGILLKKDHKRSQGGEDLNHRYICKNVSKHQKPNQPQDPFCFFSNILAQGGPFFKSIFASKP